MQLATGVFKSIETRYRLFLSESMLGSTYIMRSIPLKVSSSVPKPNCSAGNSNNYRSCEKCKKSLQSYTNQFTEAASITTDCTGKTRACSTQVYNTINYHHKLCNPKQTDSLICCRQSDCLYK